jgi:hypothetical protein
MQSKVSKLSLLPDSSASLNGLLFKSKVGGNIFLQNAMLSVNYTA